MMNNEVGRIWRPNVQPNSNSLPYPDSSSSQTRQEVYTKASIKLTDGFSRDTRSLNREILNASQAFNNSPKPFVGTTNKFTESTNKSVRLSEQKQYSNPQSTSVVPKARFEEENMAPKLVHNPYNSPIDLYSMNNIRKTIEAHTELIAPGIKGINFMKAETPVNKQSEVYKLVMEEEHQQSRHKSHLPTTCVSPISGRPATLPSLVSEHQARGEQANDTVHVSNQEQLISQGHEKSLTKETPKFRPPTCFECGQIIVGPFAKIKDRCVHPHCFNCTTCGTSLKNSGYFTVNDKLYCEIHARQVANMMRINYDFNEEREAVANRQFMNQNQDRREDSQVNESSNVDSSSTIVGRDAQSFSAASNAEITRARPVNLNQSTMDSSVFTNRCASCNGSMSETKRESRWTWAPSTNQLDGCSSSAGISIKASQHHDSTITRQQNTTEKKSHSDRYGLGENHQHEQACVSHDARGRGLMIHENSGSRVPICVHCNMQILGPYILANKTTWCKPCSQTHFICCSCCRPLLDLGFIEDGARKYYCEHCFDAYYAPTCFKCNIRVKGDCLNALGKKWHPSCFVCGHCKRPFGNSSFYLEDNVPYCERDWNILFTTKCYSCSYPIEAGDKWVEALGRNYHSNCFKCFTCQQNLEGSTFYCKAGKPYCRLHVR